MIYIEYIYIWYTSESHIHFYTNRKNCVMLSSKITCKWWVRAVVIQRSITGCKEQRPWSQATLGLEESCLTSLCLSFLITRMGLNENLPQTVSLRINWPNLWNRLKQCLVCCKGNKTVSYVYCFIWFNSCFLIFLQWLNIGFTIRKMYKA